MQHLHLATTTSTMDEAARRVAEGDTQTFAISASEQTVGRGRRGRPWQTFPHRSLAVTYILHPAQGPHLPLIAALALHQALAPLQSGLQIKWPNDLLLNGKKVAGILCENLGTHTSLVGIGLNVTPPEEIPPEFTGTFLYEGPNSIPSGAQKALTSAPDALVSQIGTCLLQALNLYWVGGWSALHNNYLQHCVTIGKKVRWITSQKQELTGTARGLNEVGQLEMVAEDGTVHVIHSGDIIEYK